MFRKICEVVEPLAGVGGLVNSRCSNIITSNKYNNESNIYSVYNYTSRRLFLSSNSYSKIFNKFSYSKRVYTKNCANLKDIYIQMFNSIKDFGNLQNIQNHNTECYPNFRAVGTLDYNLHYIIRTHAYTHARTHTRTRTHARTRAVH